MKSNLTNHAHRLWRRSWSGLALLFCFAPPLALFAQAALDLSVETAVHIARTVLPYELGYSLLAAAGGTLCGLLLAFGGVAATLFEFRGRSLLVKLLLIPLLIPAAYVATLYKDALGVDGVWLLLPVLGSSAAPLFQLVVGAAIDNLSHRYAMLLTLVGRGHPLQHARFVLPLAVPAAAATGVVAFVMMGGDAITARICAVPTLAVGVLDRWFGIEDAAFGALVSLVSLAVSLLPALLLWRMASRRSWRETSRAQTQRRERGRLPGWWGAVPWLLCAPQLIAGVLVPLLSLIAGIINRLDAVNLEQIASAIAHTFFAGGAGLLLAVLLALFVLWPNASAGRPRSFSFASATALLAFALPPVVLGLSFLWLLPNGDGTGIIASINATCLPLVTAFGIRFCAVFIIVGNAMLLQRAHRHAALMQTLGRTGLRSFVRLIGPFVAGPGGAAGAFVFLEIIKEWSLPLVLQPFDFTTLSTRLFQYLQIGRIQESSVYVLCIALVGIYPLFTLARFVGDAPVKRRL